MKSDSLLARLQAANPEPLIVQTDSFDLFNEITALPADPRLSTPARKPFLRRRGLALAVAFAAARSSPRRRSRSRGSSAATSSALT